MGNPGLNHIKKRNRRKESSLETLTESGYQIPSPVKGPDAAAELTDLRGTLDVALERLQSDHREIITLRHLHELSYQEIAECLDIPKGTVMSRLHTARKKLREVLELAEDEKGLECRS
jgi:RNA polymerase sigma-70 factor (ECF subfamily)